VADIEGYQKKLFPKETVFILLQVRTDIEMGVTGIKYDEETVDKEIVRGLLAPSLNNTLKFEESQSAIRAMYLQKIIVLQIR